MRATFSVWLLNQHDYAPTKRENFQRSNHRDKNSHPQDTVAMDNNRAAPPLKPTSFTVCVQLSSRSEPEIRFRNRTSHLAGQAGTFGYIRLRSVRIGNDAGK
jgi:hypothetical protein